MTDMKTIPVVPTVRNDTFEPYSMKQWLKCSQAHLSKACFSWLDLLIGYVHRTRTCALGNIKRAMLCDSMTFFLNAQRIFFFVKTRAKIDGARSRIEMLLLPKLPVPLRESRAPKFVWSCEYGTIAQSRWSISISGKESSGFPKKTTGRYLWNVLFHFMSMDKSC